MYVSRYSESKKSWLSYKPVTVEGMMNSGKEYRYCKNAMYLSAPYNGEYPKEKIVDKLPECVWNFDSLQCQYFINELTKNESTLVVYSELLANELMHLALRAEWSCNMTKGEGENYILTFYREYLKVTSKHSTEYLTEYKGPVFCLEMPFETF